MNVVALKTLIRVVPGLSLEAPTGRVGVAAREPLGLC